jgi:polyisoprenoid-binding protein YceI
MKYIYTSFPILSLLFISLPLHAAEYEIDPSHSRIGFKIKHLAISNVQGQFADVNGKIDYDPKAVESSKASASIKVASINTAQEKRDEHLKSDDFFNAKEFPEISFVSKEIKNATPKSFTALGDLTIRGVTKPVTLDVSVEGEGKDPNGKDRVAFAAKTKVDRRDFGLTWSKILETGALVVGNDVFIELEIEAVKKS